MSFNLQGEVRTDVFNQVKNPVYWRKSAMKPIANSLVGAAKAAPAAGILGFRTVASYRLYCLDGVNKVATAEWIDADDDRTAIELAYELKDGMPCELWQGVRFVARLPAGHHD